MGVKSFLKTALRITTRIIGYGILLSLPVTLFPSIHTAILGIKLSQYQKGRVQDGIHALAREIDRVSWMDQFSMPGAPTIWDWQDNKEPFFIPQLRSVDWTAKLGFVKPIGHGFDVWDPDMSIDKIASFDGLMRDMRTQRDMPKEWWVYVSSGAMPTVFPWDAAFRELLEYHQQNALSNGTAFANVQCWSAPFLCNVWHISGLASAALVHLIVLEDGEIGIDVNLTDYCAAPEDLRPVVVRITDLGLQSHVSPLAPGVFPTRFEQMKALTSNEGAYTIFEEYSEVSRMFKRHQDIVSEERSRRKGRLLPLVFDLDDLTTDFLAKPLGLDSAVDEVAQVVYLISTLLAGLVTWIIDFGQASVYSFLGKPTEFDVLFERLQQRQQANHGGNIFDGLLNFL